MNKDTGEVNGKNVPIIADITFSSKRVLLFIGYRIDADKWVDKVVGGVRVQEVKKNNFNLKGESATKINARIMEVRRAIDSCFQYLEVQKIEPTIKSVRQKIKDELNISTRNNCFKTYLLKDKGTGLYKIGRAINPYKRLRTLSTSQTPIKLNYEVISICNFDIEKMLHQAFSHKRRIGEWFDLDKENIEIIDRIFTFHNNYIK